MKHLTIDEIIDFVSIRRLDPESMELVRRVNSHILGCKECLAKVKAFQAVYDEMIRMGKSEEFKTSVQKALSDVAEAEKEKKTGDCFLELRKNRD